MPLTDPVRPVYRPDIDGLRAVAVLAVVAFHAFPTWVRGGFIGVDIFFVISGFLITTILLKSLQEDRFTISQFYARRIRRILPALLAVLAATAAFGWAVLLGGEFRTLGTHVSGGAGFVSNFVLWGESGYFDSAADTKPLLHLWSLSIEEQFYIAWPLVLALTWARKHAAVIAICLLATASFTFSVVTAGADATAAYYSPLSRAWELMIGSALAYAAVKWPRAQARASNWQSATGVALIAIALVATTEDKPFPGWWAVLPTLGVGLVISAGPSAWLNRQLLSNRLLVCVGLISYPLYLWHWPLLSFGRIISGGLPGRLTRLLLIGSAMLLAFLTYRFLERPFRRIEHWNRAVTALVVLLAVSALAGLGAGFGVYGPRMRESRVSAFTDAMGDWDFPSRGFTAARVGANVLHEIRTPNRTTTLFVGDSFVQQYGPRIDRLLAADPDRHNSVVFATAGGCPPVPGVTRLPAFAFYPCESMRSTAFELARSPAIDTVVLGTNWYGLFDPADRDSRLVFGQGEAVVSFPDPRALDLAYASLGRTIAGLSREKRVFLLLPPPTGPAFDPKTMLTGSRFGQLLPRPDIEAVNLASWRAAHDEVRRRLLATASANGALVIDPVSTMCAEGRCPVIDDEGRPLYKDGSHMRPFHVRQRAVFIDQTLTVRPGPPQIARAAEVH